MRRSYVVACVVVGIAAIVTVTLYWGYAAIRPRFEVKGDVRDEQGVPLDAAIMVNEGYDVSITNTRYEERPAPVVGGKFDIVTAHCSVVGLWFIAPGYKSEFRSYSKLSQVPPTLHIVLKKKQSP